MTAFTRCSIVLVLGALLPAPAFAQTQSVRERDMSPASATTLAGDTGLWFVSAPEVLPAGVINAGAYGASEARNEGGSKPASGAASIALGIANRAEVFGTWLLTTELDGTRGRGDLLAGTKIGVLSQGRGAPLGLAARGVVKLPTGNDTLATSTGKTDVLAELVASRQFGRVELTGSSGVVWRGDTDGVDLPNGIRSGLGLAVLAHRSLRLFTEVHGEVRGSGDAVPLLSAFDTPPTASAGVSWNFARMLTASAGVNRAVGGRDEARGVGVAVRIGYRPGARRPAAAPSVAPQPTVTPAPPAPPASTSVAPAAPVTSAPPAPPAPVALTFDDVHFDFDRATLRPESMPLIDRAYQALRENPSLRLQIDGHTCEIGTTEYNLALGEQRARVVRDYLVSRGVDAARLSIRSYGEERPKHDMATEATRALNRRAELVPVSVPSANR